MYNSGPARPFLRTRGAVVLAAAGAAAAAFAFRYNAASLKSNEDAQRAHKAPNGYVAVDRSGGGI